MKSPTLKQYLTAAVLSVAMTTTASADIKCQQCTIIDNRGARHLGPNMTPPPSPRANFDVVRCKDPKLEKPDVVSLNQSLQRLKTQCEKIGFKYE